MRLSPEQTAATSRLQQACNAACLCWKAFCRQTNAPMNPPPVPKQLRPPPPPHLVHIIHHSSSDFSCRSRRSSCCFGSPLLYICTFFFCGVQGHTDVWELAQLWTEHVGSLVSKKDQSELELIYEGLQRDDEQFEAPTRWGETFNRWLVDQKWCCGFL